MTLDQFLKDNRTELIKRTRAKVASRASPPADAIELENGVPIFLSQLSAALADQGPGGTSQSSRASHAAHPEISESAARHGKELLKLGYTIDQVVHDYGDVCQAVTELAEERHVTVSLPEFHTLNRCLDNAIAGAVTSWSAERDRTRGDGAAPADTFRRELGRLLDQATTTFDVIRDGRVGPAGATGTLLRRALVEMRTLLDRGE